MFNLRRLKFLLECSGSTLRKGIEYYKNGAVKETRLYETPGGSGYVLDSRIQGSVLYKTFLEFNREYVFESYHCDCPVYQRSGAICKHVAALYSYLINSQDFKNTFNYIAANDFLSIYFSKKEESVKKRVVLDYQVEFDSFRGDNYAFVSLKMGVERLYVVKDIRNLIEVMLGNENIINFGKSFTFNPRIHDFTETDKKVIDFFVELYWAEKTMKQDSTFNSGSIFYGKRLKMNEMLFIKFLKLLDNNMFSLKTGDLVIENVIAEFDELPFMVTVENKGGNVAAKIKYMDDSIFFRGYDNILYSNKKLYVIDKKNKAYAFAKATIHKKTDTLEFMGERKNMFLSIVPQIMGYNNVHISEDITSSYVQVPLEAASYIDRYKKGISVKLEFKYQDVKIDPIYKSEISPYIIRDYQKEERILELIDDAGFKVNDNVVHLDDMDKVYIFFRDILPTLSSYCSIFYTDDVRGMYLGRVRGFKGQANIRPSNGLIEINIDIEGIDRKEIKDLLKSMKEKKKYHKLRNGKLLSLEGEETQELLNLVEQVEVDEIKNNIISLSRYRALGVFQKLRSSTMSNIENIEEINEVVKRIKSFNEQNIPLPESFDGVLRDYQVTGFKWMKTLSELGFGGVLADDMGLGKTLQAISLVFDSKDSVSLVVSPSSLIYNWENEIKRFAPSIKALVVSGAKRDREELIGEILNYDVIITSYPLLRRDIELYEGIEFKYCILDEAQHIKNPESISAQSAKRINAFNRFALTGTPMENSIVELWSIFDFLMPGYLFSRNKFAERFERPIVRNGDKDKLVDLKRMISPFVLRRKKKDVLLELPDKIETKLVCDLTEEQKNLYTAYLARTKDEIENLIEEEGFEKSKLQILAALTRLRQICCHPSVFVENYVGGSGKLDVLEELLSELIDGNHRILLFSQFTSLLDIIKGLLLEKGIEYMYLDGSTPVEERMNLVEGFNSGHGKIFLISLKAGGTGLNLTSADTVIHFDPWWNPAVEDQASDRAHRIGQKSVVQVFKIITKDTIEEKIYELQNRKKELINSVIQEGETFINTLSREEILGILNI